MTIKQNNALLVISDEDNQQLRHHQSQTKMKCRICNEEVKNRFSNHIYKHGYDSLMYRDRFLTELTSNEILRLNHSVCVSETNKREWDTKRQKRLDIFINSFDRHKLRPDVSRLNSDNWLNQDYRNKMTEMSRNNFTNVLKGWRRGHKLYKKSDGQIVRLRSSWEVMTAILLDMSSIAWNYEHAAFRSDLNTGWYIPDFYLVDFNIYLEVKCLFSNLKIVEVVNRIENVEQNCSIQILIVSDAELRSLVSLKQSKNSLLKDFISIGILPTNYNDINQVNFDDVKFNDYPGNGSTDKCQEVQRNLKALIGSRYSLVSQETVSCLSINKRLLN